MVLLAYKRPLAAFFGLFVVMALPAMAAGPVAYQVLLASMVLGAGLAVLSAIDLVSLRLPDVLTVPLLISGLILCAYFQWDDVRLRIAAAALGYGVLYAVAWLYHRWRGRHGLGLGDAKLLAVSGAWLGIEGLPSTLLIACLAALGGALAATLAGRPVAADTRIPFGPFLAGATWLLWLYGPLL